MQKLLSIPLLLLIFLSGCEHVSVQSRTVAPYPREALVQMQQVIDENQALIEFAGMALTDESEAMTELQTRYAQAREDYNAFVDAVVQTLARDPESLDKPETPSQLDLKQSYRRAQNSFRDFRKYAHDVGGIPLESELFTLIPSVDVLLAYIGRARDEEPNVTSNQAAATLGSLHWPAFGDL